MGDATDQPTNTAAARPGRGAGTETTGAPGAGKQHSVFLGRQPIFDKRLDVYAYELLYRSGTQNAFTGDDGDQATRVTIGNSLNVLGLGDVAGAKMIFFNITRGLLMDEFYAVLPPDRTVVELLETVEPDEEVIAACARLREEGYLLALDDFVFGDAYRPLLAIADFVKVDFMATDREQRRALIEEFGRPGLSFLAERIEKPEEFEEAAALGYKYFQGYFFAKPKIIVGSDIPGGKERYLLLLRSVQGEEIDFDQIEKIIKSDGSLSVKLLRYLNSAALGMREKITSIKQSLVLLGERPLRKWASLLAMTCMGEDKPTELIRISLARAQFCELLCEDLGLNGRQIDLFMLGLLSALDALLDCPLADVLAHLPLSSDVKATLLGDSTPLGKLQMLVLACERGDWKTGTVLGRMLGLPEQRVADVHAESLRWADEVLSL
ncbi:MAG: HDOD domain-containing protein [Planctomycetota bacterium]|nr:HDOD domain-containing protein [Planctomycetota bacterium]